MLAFLIASLVPLTIWHFFLCFICLFSKSEKLFSDERDKKALNILLCLKEGSGNIRHRLFICVALFICSLTGAIVGLINYDINQNSEEGTMACAFFTIIPFIVAFYLLYQFFRNFKNSTRKQKIVKGVCGALCVCIAIAMTLLAVINPSFDSNSTPKKNDYSNLTKEEKQWYQDNYGDGQYEKYKDAVNNYKGYK